jgi:hypothetical protein
LTRVTNQWGDIDLVDQVTEKCCLRQNLDIHERRGRLEDDRGKFFTTMKPTRRHDVADGNSEDQPADHGGNPSPNLFPDPHRPASNRVVASIDRLEQWFEMGRRPGGTSGGQ